MQRFSNTASSIDPAAFYRCFSQRVQASRQQLNRPLTLTEKILLTHTHRVGLRPSAATPSANTNLADGEYVDLYPDRVALQDVTGQMALLQLMSTNRQQVAVPCSLHCDHLIAARRGAGPDLRGARQQHKEVYDFLTTACQKYGITFWQPGSGIIHQVVFECVAFPGALIIGTDSHTPNAGGLSTLAIGVGGGDAVDVLAGGAFNLAWPKVIGVRLTGRLQGWSSPKDIILKLMGVLGVRGGTGCVVEFFGPGCASLSATGRATITNMGAEHGATTSVFPYDAATAAYLRATDRKTVADAANACAADLRADDVVLQEPDRYYDRVIPLDLDTLQPHIVGPHSPDKTRPIKQLKEEIQREQYPDKLSVALIGSCTNSSYEDLGRAADVAKQASAHGLKSKVPLYVTPGSASVYQTAKQAGYIDALEKIGATVLSNACGPCIGQWHRADPGANGPNSILSSYNRNFPGRNDGQRYTLSFLASPEMVTAMALFGRLSANPLTDTLTAPDGKQIRLTPPQAKALPSSGLRMNIAGRVDPLRGLAPKPSDNPERSERSSGVANKPLRGLAAKTSGEIEPSKVTVDVKSKAACGSDRLAPLTPFPRWDGKDFCGLPVLLKAVGKCTTDHISPAGAWLRYRGHLDKIADNTYLGAVNAFTPKPGTGVDITQPSCPPQLLSTLARDYKAKGMRWIVVGDTNFGEGSSREHAAMQPRHLGCCAIIARGFARIHETNLKKHGVLPLIFDNDADYDRLQALDRVDVLGLAKLAPNKPVDVVLHHADGTRERIVCRHTLSDQQIQWFRAGSSLNFLTRPSR